MVDYVKDTNNRLKMMKNYNDAKNPYTTQNVQRTVITLEDLEAIQFYKDAVGLTKTAMASFAKVINAIAKKDIIISDRRINWCLDIMKASALYNGRTQVLEDDIKALVPVLWERVEDIPVIVQEINKLVDPYTEKINSWYSEAMGMISEANTLNMKDDAESKKKSYEATIEAKTNVDVILSKMSNTINDMSKKGKDITKAVELKDKVNNELANIVSRILNIPASSMVQQQGDFNATPDNNLFTDAPF